MCRCPVDPVAQEQLAQQVSFALVSHPLLMCAEIVAASHAFCPIFLRFTQQMVEQSQQMAAARQQQTMQTMMLGALFCSAFAFVIRAVPVCALPTAPRPLLWY